MTSQDLAPLRRAQDMLVADESIDDIVNQTVGRALDLFDIDAGIVKRWRSAKPLREDEE